MMKKLFLILFIFVLLLPSMVSAATYYVDNNASTGSVGSQGDPFSIADINAKNNWSDEDVILLCRGQTYSTTALTLASSNTSISLTVRAAESAEWGGCDSGTKPTFDSDDLSPSIGVEKDFITFTIANIKIAGTNSSPLPPNQTTWYSWVYFDDMTNLVVDGLDGENVGSTNSYASQSFIYIRPEDDDDVIDTIEIKNCTISNILDDDGLGAYDYAGVLIYHQKLDPDDEPYPSSISIHDNTISNVGSDSIQIQYFRNNTNPILIYNNTLSNFGENAIDIKNSDYLRIYNNTISNKNFATGGYPLPADREGSIITSVGSGSNNWIYENYLDGNYDSDGVFGPSIYGFLGGSNNKIYRNKIKDCYPAIWVNSGSSTDIHNNIIHLEINPTTPATDCGTGGASKRASYLCTGIELGVVGSVTYSNVYNNTVYGEAANAGSAIHVGNYSGTGTKIKNNIFSMTNASGYPYIRVAAATSPTIDYNDYYNSGGANRINDGGTLYTTANFGTWQVGASHDISADPEMADPAAGDFNLVVGKPPIDAAFDFGGNEYDLGLISTTTFGVSANGNTGNRDTYGWDIGAYVYLPAAAPPTISGVLVDANGTKVTITFSAAVTQNPPAFDGTEFNLDISGGATDITMTYVSGDTGAAHIYTAGQTILASDVVNLDCDTDENALENGAGEDLEDINDVSVSNGSAVGASSAGVTITGTGNVTIE